MFFSYPEQTRRRTVPRWVALFTILLAAAAFPAPVQKQGAKKPALKKNGPTAAPKKTSAPRTSKRRVVKLSLIHISEPTRPY